MPESQNRAEARKLQIGGTALFFCLLACLIFFPKPAFAKMIYYRSMPIAYSISPSSGSSNPGEAVIFTATYIDYKGAADIRTAVIVINDKRSRKNCFYALYDHKNNKLYLRSDDDKNWLGGFAPNSANIIQNSYAILDCAKTSVEALGIKLTIKWTVSFKDTFTGSKNIYLFAKGRLSPGKGFKQAGTWVINKLLAISVNPNFWDIGEVSVNSVTTMPKNKKIVVTNNSSGPVALELRLVNPTEWTEGEVNDKEKYVLSALFCSTNEVPQAYHFNQNKGTEDIISIQPKRATAAVFGYRYSTANGVRVSKGGQRSLYLQFIAPKLTEITKEQNISVVVSCQAP